MVYESEIAMMSFHSSLFNTHSPSNATFTTSIIASCSLEYFTLDRKAHIKYLLIKCLIAKDNYSHAITLIKYLYDKVRI